MVGAIGSKLDFLPKGLNLTRLDLFAGSGRPTRRGVGLEYADSSLSLPQPPRDGMALFSLRILHGDGCSWEKREKGTKVLHLT